MRFTFRPHMPEDGLDAEEQCVLNDLAKVATGYALQRPENKYWNRGCDRLVARGLVEDHDGAVCLTDAGRNQLKSNSRK